MDWTSTRGGGTYFRKLDERTAGGGGEGGSSEGSGSDSSGGGDDGVLRLPKGHIVAHSSALMHGGHPTTRGVRYILVAFCTIAPEYADWASRLYKHVNEHVDPGEVGGFAPRALPRGMLTAGAEYRQARQWSLEGERL